MNIFATSDDPHLCAIWLDDKRLVKMVLETAQLLCTAMNVNGFKTPYKTTHLNHPCALWVRCCSGNLAWTIDHMGYLLEEYKDRYGRDHNSGFVMPLAESFLEQEHLLNLVRQPFSNCTEFKDITDVHEAYRKQMNVKWVQDIQSQRPASWRIPSHKPDWCEV